MTGTYGYSTTNSDRMCIISFACWKFILRDGIRETAIVREEGETPNDRNDRSESVVYRP